MTCSKIEKSKIKIKLNKTKDEFDGTSQKLKLMI